LVQLGAEQESQLDPEAELTDPSALPKLHADISRLTPSVLHCGQFISCPFLNTSFSNLLSQELHRYSYIGI